MTGYDATSVRDRNMLQASDREVSALCFAEDRILVTNNAKDFLELAEGEGVHPGLVFMPLGSQKEMCGWMRSAIEEIERLAAATKSSPAALMLNSVVEVDEAGSCIRYEYP